MTPLLRSFLVVLGCLAGCAAPPAAPVPSGLPIVLAPPMPRVAALDPVAAKAAVAVERDTAALSRQATRYVVRRDSKPELIDRLAVLVTQMRSAVDRMRAGKTRAGYRPGDVVAARVAADALAAFIAVQIVPPTVPAALELPRSAMPTETAKPEGTPDAR